MKVNPYNIGSKYFKERPKCRRAILQMMKEHNWTLTELAENYHFFGGTVKQLKRMLLEEKRKQEDG